MKNYGTRFFWMFLITGLSLLVIFREELQLGLDLRGGASLTYKVTAEGGVDPKKIAKAIQVIDKRLNATGLSEVYPSSTTADQILIEMPGRSKSETDSIKGLIERNGDLEFRILAPNEMQVDELEKKNAAAEYYTTPENHRWVPNKEGHGRGELLVIVPEEAATAKVKKLTETLGEKHPDTIRAQRELEDIIDRDVFRGEDLASSGVERNGAQIVVAFAFKDGRKAQFGDFTKRNIRQQMAIILDKVVQSSPVIKSPLPGSGVIEGGGDKGFQTDDAESLSIVLESGSTGVKMTLEREESLGASLGAVAIERGKWSVIVGFAAVVALMLWWYRVPGFVAIFALFLNLVIMLGLLAFFHAALSLPGIAGIVLTLGMAVDANVLIFERLRDERKRGKGLAESLAAGYDRAMSAIIDGHVTTILTALVLIFVGTGPVRGFGVTLTIGLLASLYTSVFVTRAIFEWGLEKGIFKSFSIGKDPFEPKLDYVRARRFFTLPALTLSVLGVVVFLSRDEADSKDIEFVGGQQVVIQLDQPMDAGEVTRLAQGPAREYQSATPVPLATSAGSAPSGASDRWQIRVKASNQKEGDEYVRYLATTFKDHLVATPFSAWEELPKAEGEPDRAAVTVHLLTPVPDAAKLKDAVAGAGVADVRVTPEPGSGDKVFRLEFKTEGKDPAAIKDAIGKAVRTLKDVSLSDPFPSLAFLANGPAQEMWRTALYAIFLSLLIQVVYIRMRFADFAHGFAAVVADLHDVCIALGAVAVADHFGFVYAKVNLTLIAAFLTLIGYSMNDTIVVFDRIRENMGKSGILRSKLINDSINQTFSRSIRTTVTTWAVVLIQFLFNRNLGSVLEGFAWVMVIGCIAGAYSSIFIAAPLLLFLPVYGKILFGNKPRLIAQFVATIAGVITALVAKEKGWEAWVGFALAANLPIHFMWYFVPWLSHPDPDALLAEHEPLAQSERPIRAPGI